MGYRTRNPHRFAGAVITSGNMDTGEINWTRGGMRLGCFFSGGLRSLGSGAPAPVAQTADHAVFWSGAGRLNTVFPHQAISGVAIHFYDSAVVARSGPNTYMESGYRLIAVIPANTWDNRGGTLEHIQVPMQFDVPFYSGLAVIGTSGVAGCTFTWTPEATRSGGLTDEAN